MTMSEGVKEVLQERLAQDVKASDEALASRIRETASQLCAMITVLEQGDWMVTATLCRNGDTDQWEPSISIRKTVTL